MWAKNQTRAFAGQELFDSLNFLLSGFLFGDHVVETKHHQRVGVGEHPFVERQSLARLVDSLVNSDGLPRSLADERLEPYGRQVEQLKRAGNSLQKHLF